MDAQFAPGNQESPAGDTHVAIDGGAPVAPVDDEVMSLRFASNSVTDRLLKKLVAFGATQGRTKVGGILLAEAHEEGAGAS